MKCLVDLTFWEVFFIAVKVVSAWVLASVSSVLSLVLGILFLIGIGAIVAVVLRYLSEKMEKKQ